MLLWFHRSSSNFEGEIPVWLFQPSPESSVIFNWWSSSVLWKHVLSEMRPGCTPLIHAFIHIFYVPDRMWNKGNRPENKTQYLPSRFWLGAGRARVEVETGLFGECRMGSRCPGSRGRHVTQSRKLEGPCPPCQAALWVKRSRWGMEKDVCGGYSPELGRCWEQVPGMAVSNVCESRHFTSVAPKWNTPTPILQMRK